ncbi:uncharacterized protein LOC135844776 [Planococcus citri]|uniref:uncharacterized protein LOC135844776 n=1 Tax=Planococcus citri TaxID=170843 RepID=UPI0031F9BF9D
MNNLSFICGTLLIGIISANANPVHSQVPSDNNPSLSCVLFKELGCDVQCTFMAKLQDSTSETSASCNDEQKCTCTVKSDESDDSLVALWNKKFEADDDLIEQIRQGRSLPRKVKQVLKKNASRTGEQCKQALATILPKRLYSQIRVKQNNTTEINQTKIDVESIKQLVNEDEVNSVMRNSPEFYSTNLNCLSWVHNFFVYLKARKQSASIQSIYHQVDLTGNGLLKEKLGFFLKKNDAPKIDTTIKYEQDNAASQIVANMVVDGMIKSLGLPKCFPRSS